MHESTSPSPVPASRTHTGLGVRVLMISSSWPTDKHPEHAPFVVRQVDFLRRKGVMIDVFHLDGRRRPLNYARSWRHVRGLLARHKYDVVHAQWGQAALLAFPKVHPLVITFRGSDLEGIVGSDGRYTWSGTLLRTISQTVARAADEVIVVSESLARHLPNRPCHVIPSGVDLDLFRSIPMDQARRQLGLDLSRRYVLFAASPANPVKRYAIARAAVDRLKPMYDVELLATAGVPHTLIPVYMSACDALLLTSRHEGSPNVVKEALACDLPVVSVDVGDVRARIASIEGCALCPVDTPEAIAESLVEVLRRGRRVAGRQSVSALDEGLLAERVIAVYRQAMGHSVLRFESTITPNPAL